MISIYDVLKASKGIHVDDTFAELWGRKLSNAYSVMTYTGTLPATLTGTKAGYLESYKIYGNTEQDSGTPTPESPIMPSGCGERTENLWDRDVPQYVYAKDYKRYNPDNAIALKAGTYTISSDSVCPIIQAFDANHRRLNIGDALTYASSTYYKIWDGEAIGPASNIIHTATITLLLDCILTFAVNGAAGSYIMLNLGSTALPYEPYGYKLPLTANGVEYPIYLGGAQLSNDEYVDSETGKIYHNVGGELTPIDPPVPFPQIPTAAGTTVIDYDGEGLAPSEVELTYRKPKGQ